MAKVRTRRPGHVQTTTVSYAWLCDHLGVTSVELPHVVRDDSTRTLTMYIPAQAPRTWGRQVFGLPAAAYPHITIVVARVRDCPLLCLYGTWQEEERARQGHMPGA